MDFPTYTKNATVETKPLTITAPPDVPSETAEQRWLKQQWRDVKEQGIEKTHPLSLNRDSGYVTTDPYNV